MNFTSIKIQVKDDFHATTLRIFIHTPHISYITYRFPHIYIIQHQLKTDIDYMGVF